MRMPKWPAVDLGEAPGCDWGRGGACAALKRRCHLSRVLAQTRLLRRPPHSGNYTRTRNLQYQTTCVTIPLRISCPGPTPPWEVQGAADIALWMLPGQPTCSRQLIRADFVLKMQMGVVVAHKHNCENHMYSTLSPCHDPLGRLIAISPTRPLQPSLRPSPFVPAELTSNTCIKSSALQLGAISCSGDRLSDIANGSQSPGL